MDNKLMNKVLICFVVIGFTSATWPEYPKNEFEYSLERDQLLQAERQFQGKDPRNLTADEKIVSDYLQYLKWEEFEATRDNFAPFRPIEEVKDVISQSKVYEVLWKLPKGGNMHTHENHELSKRTLLEIVWDSEDFEHLYMLPEDDTENPYMLDFFITPPSASWINVQDASIQIDDIIQYHTLIGLMDDYARSRPTDSATRWKQMGPLWTRATNLIFNIKIRPLYLEALLRQALEEGVTYLETRKNLGPGETLYELDASYPEDNGRRPVGDAELDIELMLEVIEQIQQEFPEFIGLRRVVYTTRYSSVEDVQAEMERVVDLHIKYPDHVIAFDLVGEEDGGNSHLFYLRSYLQLYSNETQRSQVALKLHTAETNWPGDLISGTVSDIDPMATLMNTYESILLGANRIGHGLGFIKHPYMLDIIKERGVAIESCVVSNQILGYMADLRNHPATHFMKRGIPVLLGSDDPGTFGYDNFTSDWYQAFMGWGLDLMDLKTLARNSIYYSSLSETDRDAALSEKWEPTWLAYINDMREEACSTDFTGSQPLFGSILPREGWIDSSTNVHIFGRHFEHGICSNLVCDFGGIMTSDAYYVSNNHIICSSPALDQSETVTVPVLISFDAGVNFYDTDELFTYKYSYDPVGSSPKNEHWLLLVFLCTFLCISI